MRIAILSFEFPPATAFGGISTYSAQLADMLANANHDVEVFAGGANVETFTRESGAVVHTFGATDPVRFAVPVTVAFCRRQLEKPFDVLETPEYLAPARAIADSFDRLAVVVRLHTPVALIARINLPQGKWRRPWFDIFRQAKNTLAAALNRQVLPSVHFANENLLNADRIDQDEAAVARRADIICSPSRALVTYPKKHWGIPAAKTVHLPNMYQAPAAILSIPLPTAPTCIGYFGRLEVRKGILTLAKTLPAIARDFPKTKMLFVGQSLPLEGVHPDAKEYLSNLCRKLGLDAEFAGRQPNDRLHQWYSRCEIVMLPSVWENFPYVCLEAMAAGRAVIGSREGGMADMIVDNETGFLADPAQPTEFAAAALKLLQDPALITKLGAAARRSVIARYSPSALRAGYEEVYRDAIAQRSSLNLANQDSR